MIAHEYKRHSHATELSNTGVSIDVVRKRLGHASTETTQIYTLLVDKIADDEIRAARRCQAGEPTGNLGSSREQGRGVSWRKTGNGGINAANESTIQVDGVTWATTRLSTACRPRIL